MSTLSDLYTDRARKGYTIEERRAAAGADERFYEKPSVVPLMAEYKALQAQLLALSRDYVATWQRPRATLPLDWCSVCGSAEQPRLVGQNVCLMCEALTIQPDTHCLLHGTAECRLCAREAEDPVRF